MFTYEHNVMYVELHRSECRRALRKLCQMDLESHITIRILTHSPSPANIFSPNNTQTLIEAKHRDQRR